MNINEYYDIALYSDFAQCKACHVISRLNPGQNLYHYICKDMHGVEKIIVNR